MFAKFLVVLCAANVPFTCSTQGSQCFPLTMNVTKSQDRQNPPNKTEGPRFDETLEEAVNNQINAELSAHYTYLSMSYYFDQDDHYMPGFRKFFKKMAEEEHEHAQMFMEYQNKRGGRIRLNSIPKPCHDGNWQNGTMAMKKALHLEKTINNLLLELHGLGSEKKETQFLDFLESNFLGEQVDSIKELSNYVHILQRLNSPLGEYQFDKLTLGGSKD